MGVGGEVTLSYAYAQESQLTEDLEPSNFYSLTLTSIESLYFGYTPRGSQSCVTYQSGCDQDQNRIKQSQRN